MAKITIVEGLRVGFPGRDSEFCAGVEIGVLATLMALSIPEFKRTVSHDNAEQARVLSQSLGYSIVGSDRQEDGGVRLAFSNQVRAPHLQLIWSKADDDPCNLHSTA
jgi:hypothetical protein